LIGTVDRGGLLRSCLVDTLHDHKGNEMTPSQFFFGVVVVDWNS